MLVSFSPTISNPGIVQNNISFVGNRHKFIKDIFIRTTRPAGPACKGISHISGVKSSKLGGTTCNGAITMKKFWALFEPSSYQEIRNKGLSTNKDGIPHSFLKAKADVPISTSFVHDCSVMYLYNEAKKTHCIYHAAYDCKPRTLDFIIETLMPEGFSHGSITPGDRYWYNRHIDNMKNMFSAMKRHNRDAIINVYSEVSKYPEIVGYKGRTYEILNADFQQQVKNFQDYVKDNGQASFKIVDLQGYNTFDKISYHCNSVEDYIKLKKYFKRQAYNEEINSVLDMFLDKRLENIQRIQACKSLEELQELEEINGKEYNTYLKVILRQKEELLIEEFLQIKDIPTFTKFYEKVLSIPYNSYMDKLHDLMARKKF